MPPVSRDTAEYIAVAGRRLHGRWLSPNLPDTPIVFLHEGLGSVDLWRDFPAAVVEASGHPGLVYSRYGNGWSSPLTEPRPSDYMHTEALDVLSEIIEQLPDRPPILVGHSDGASIALIYAGSGHPVEGLVLIAPHVFVDTQTIDSISALRDSFPDSELSAKMANYHEDPEATFAGWANVWLSDDFRSWNIGEFLAAVDCPVLLVQGDHDQYGTIEQLDAIEAATAGAIERLMVAGAAHSPHLSHHDAVVAATVDFIAGLPGTS